MSRSAESPVLGCNTELEHKGRACHVQTEDSGLGHPHVITHLFVGGGRIVVSRRTDYGACVDTTGCREIVRELIRHQHGEMLAAVARGVYDELLGAAPSVRAAPREEPPVDLGIVAMAAARRREQRDKPESTTRDATPASAIGGGPSGPAPAPVRPSASSERSALVLSLVPEPPETMDLDEIIAADVRAGIR